VNYVLVTLWSLALVAAFEGARQFFRFKEEKRQAELRRRLQALGDDVSPSGSLLRDRRYAATPALDALLRATPLVDRLQRLLEQTDTVFTAGQIVGWSLLSGCVGLVLGAILRLGAIGFVLPAAGLALPTALLLVARGRRSRRVSEQLPEALDMLARSLRAGHALSASFEVVAKEMPEPVAVEFGRAYEAQRLGLPVEEALVQMCDRVPGNGDVKMLAVSATIQRETGGNLAEILSNLANTIRARYRFHGKLRALTAEGRATALVLSLLPFVVALGLRVMSPHYLDPLVQTPVGRMCLGYAVTTWLIGVVSLTRMARVDY
jgi:tight adherence protein B